MTLGLTLYRGVTMALSPLAGPLLSRRVRAGKETAGNLPRRLGYDLAPRPLGQLVWLHGASVGESEIALALGKALAAARPDLDLLLTSQTLTSACRLEPRLSPRARYQIAPVDTPGAAQRFVTHWRPDLAVFCEGDIWPNLLGALERRGTAIALVNARMTAGSLRRWERWPASARQVFSRFDTLLAADQATADGLTRIIGQPVVTPGNIKAAIPPPPADPTTLSAFRETFLKAAPCFVAASTHAGEEALVLDAWQAAGCPGRLVLAPRHPERGGEIASMLAARGLAYIQRSRDAGVPPPDHVLLADTLGELGLWYGLADLVYLGGGHTPGIGGHNPFEPVRLGAPVVSGPRVHNFEAVMQRFAEAGALQFVEDDDALKELFWRVGRGDAVLAPDKARLAAIEAQSRGPFDVTLKALLAHLPETVCT